MTEFKQKITSFELQPAGGGCFEIRLDGDLVYSKLDTGQFPEESEMVSLIGGRL